MAIPPRACRLARLIAGLLMVSSLTPVVMTPALGQQPADSTARKKISDGNKVGNQDSGASGRPRLTTLDKQPAVRVALSTDVSSCSVSCPSGLVIQSSDARSATKTFSGALRIELRRQPQPDSESLIAPRSRRDAPPAPDAGETVYRAWIASYRDAAHANKLVAELQKKFYEPTSIIFDSAQEEYDVFIGRFRQKRDADGLAARLRRDGYAGARVEIGVLGEDNAKERPPTIDDNAKLAKRQSQSASTVTRTPASGYQPMTRIVVLESGRVVASATGTLTIAAGKSMPREEEPETRPSSSVDEGRINSAASEFLRVGDRDYRGQIQLIQNSRGLINVINIVAIEDYLRGVVPMELSPTTFPALEALKAQAVAARSYALAMNGKHDAEGYDLVDDARAQVYGGATAERDLSNRAVEQTRGIVAVYTDRSGVATPIEALYTANCGGRTEDNEAVFGGEALPYLRGVSCSLDPQHLDAHQITTSRRAEPLVGSDGAPLAKEIALLDVFEFPIPRSVSGSWLRGAIDTEELRRWIERAARLAGQDAPAVSSGSMVRLPQLASLVSAAVYGDSRASRLLPPADVDYLLAGLGGEQIPAEHKADVATLLKEGVLVLPDGMIDLRSPVTRSLALQMLARAFELKPQVLRAAAAALKSDVLQASQNGRVILASSLKADNVRESKYVAVNTTSSSAAKPVDRGSATGEPGRSIAGTPVAEDAWLFRKLGGRSYRVERLILIGGEHLSYHLDQSGRIDFLEADTSVRGAASDQYSSSAQWRERITIDELRRRLARARVNVGQPEKIETLSLSPSQRVTGLSVIGDRSRANLRGRQICNALGLRENLFVVEPELDGQGRPSAFVFTGRGFGHGVGMCQTGAYGLAKEGYAFTAILQKYYTGIKLQRMY
jgi:peptidoglycan hydrolase-like amidase